MRTTATKISLGLMLTVCLGLPAFAQEGYGPHQRYQDELARPAEFDGLELGRDAPFINGRDADIGTHRGGTFELEAPPIGDTFPAIR